MFCALWLSLCFICLFSEKTENDEIEFHKSLTSKILEISGGGWAGLVVVLVILLIVAILQSLVYCIAFCGFTGSFPWDKCLLTTSCIFIGLGVVVDLMYIIAGVVVNSKTAPFNALSTSVLIYGIINLIVKIILLVNSILAFKGVFIKSTWSFAFTSVIENLFIFLFVVGYVMSIVVGVGALNLRHSLDMVVARQDFQSVTGISSGKTFINDAYSSMSSFGTVVIVAFALQIVSVGTAVSFRASSLIRTSQQMQIGLSQMIMAVILLIPLQLFGKSGLMFFGFSALKDGTYNAICALAIVIFAIGAVVLLLSFISSFCFFPVILWVVRVIGVAAFVVAIVLIVFSGIVVSQRKSASDKLSLYCAPDSLNEGCRVAFANYVTNMCVGTESKETGCAERYTLADFTAKFLKSTQGWMSLLAFAAQFIAIHFLSISFTMCRNIGKAKEGQPQPGYVTPGWQVAAKLRAEGEAAKAAAAKAAGAAGAAEAPEAAAEAGAGAREAGAARAGFGVVETGTGAGAGAGTEAGVGVGTGIATGAGAGVGADARAGVDADADADADADVNADVDADIKVEMCENTGPAGAGAELGAGAGVGVGPNTDTAVGANTGEDEGKDEIIVEIVEIENTV